MNWISLYTLLPKSEILISILKGCGQFRTWCMFYLHHDVMKYVHKFSNKMWTRSTLLVRNLLFQISEPRLLNRLLNHNKKNFFDSIKNELKFALSYLPFEFATNSFLTNSISFTIFTFELLKKWMLSRVYE